MIISDLYQTNIRCNKYTSTWKTVEFNPFDETITNDLIETNPITITVELKDFNGNPVSGKEAIITCRYGRFNSSSSGTISMNRKKVTGFTNSNGIITISYSTENTELDFINCNESTVLIDSRDTGWLTLNHFGSNFQDRHNYSSTEGASVLSTRKYKDIVELRGVFNPKVEMNNSSGIIMGYMPWGMSPARSVRRAMQGSNGYFYYLTMQANNNIECQRYNNGTSSTFTVPKNAWLNAFANYHDYNAIPQTIYYTDYCLNDEDLPDPFKTPTYNIATHSHTLNNNNTTLNLGPDTDDYRRYYWVAPFHLKGNFYIHATIKTSNFENDDFGLRICDKQELDNNNTFNSIGIWLIPGQKRLAFGYGGLEAHNTMYYDSGRPSGLDIGNGNILDLEIFIDNNYVKYIVKKHGGDNIMVKTFERTDNYNFSGDYYAYLGGGKFSTGSDSKNITVYQFTAREA